MIYKLVGFKSPDLNIMSEAELGTCHNLGGGGENKMGKIVDKYNLISM